MYYNKYFNIFKIIFEPNSLSWNLGEISQLDKFALELDVCINKFFVCYLNIREIYIYK